MFLIITLFCSYNEIFLKNKNCTCHVLIIGFLSSQLRFGIRHGLVSFWFKKSYRLSYFHAHDKHFEIGIIVDVYLDIGQKLGIV